MEIWSHSWKEFLDDCPELYLSVEDFKAGKRLNIEFDQEAQKILEKARE
ncbi:MAG: hypothetical protein ACXAC5_03505 [Promethearchaeota archaeon]|jgi:hypothetical protein